MARLLRHRKVYLGWIQISKEEETIADDLNYKARTYFRMRCIQVADEATARNVVSIISAKRALSKKTEAHFHRSPRGALKTPRK